MTTREVGVAVGGGETMPALLALPEHGPAPAVLVACDVFGRSPFYESLAARVATAGFEALVPEVFFRQGPLPERTREAAFARRARLDERGALEDLRAALRWLRERPGYAGRVGTVGFCMGGTFVLDLAAMEDDLVTVCYYGFPAGPSQRTPASPPAPIELADRMRGPILGFWGDQDAGVGMHNVAELARRLTERGASFDHRVYPGLGHGFLAASQFDPSSDAYRAACESWTMALDHWREHLRAEAAV
ncbi:MAG TPA: dienelactone hydrolase family protein [Candidatus Eisenbacteria bacterium]|nr:dienelactone hydrolase family protein [Candidatus Eisenbacteria bacterium]